MDSSGVDVWSDYVERLRRKLMAAHGFKDNAATIVLLQNELVRAEAALQARVPRKGRRAVAALVGGLWS